VVDVDKDTTELPK